MRLILARHGVTFAPGAPPVWLGGADDPPLTETGEAQARALGQSLAAAQVPIAAVWASTLCRARDFARLATEALHPHPGAPHSDDALGEIDYGLWARRSRAEVLAADPTAAAQLQAWETYAAYPANVGFAPAADQCRAQWQTWLATLAQAHPQQTAVVLAVSHHGRLRQLHRMLHAATDCGEASHQANLTPVAKMRCGHLAVLESADPQGLADSQSPAAALWRIRAWDIAPDAAVLAQLLAPPQSLR